MDFEGLLHVFSLFTSVNLLSALDITQILPQPSPYSLDQGRPTATSHTGLALRWSLRTVALGP